MKKVFISFYLILLVTVFLLSMGFDPLIHSLLGPYLKEQSDAYYQNLARGVYSLLMAELKRLPQDAWHERIGQLQAEFGYPIALTTCEDSELTGERMRKMMAGDIVVNSQGTLFHKRVPDSPYVLTMVQREEDTTVRWKIGIWGFAVFLLALFTLTLSLSFYHHLSKIKQAAADFGNGHLDSRANVPARSSLTEIATAFNDMADRIVRLITSQKELIRAVSHELRTPISRIRFGLEMLGYTTDKAGFDRHIAGIEEDIDELDALIAELLAHDLFEHHAPALQLEEYELLTWVERIVSSVAQMSRSTAFCCRAAPGAAHATGLMDARFMSRAVRNLLQNAAHYASSRVEVEVGAEGGSCVFHIDDDGPGIPELDRDRIFEPFVRLDSSRNRDSGGHGLGLTIVRQVAALHSGEVTAAGSPLGGARFTIRWPG